MNGIDPSAGFGVFIPCNEFTAAMAEIDRALASCLSARLLAKEPPTVTWEEVLPLAERLPIAAPSAAERQAFRHLFFEGGGGGAMQKDIRRRRATIELIQSILPSDDEISVPEVRRQLAAGIFGSSVHAKNPEIKVSARLQTVLQARQLQRQAIEAIMVWIDRALPKPLCRGSAAPGHHVKSTHEMAVAADALCEESSPTVGAYMDSVVALAGDHRWPAAAALPGTDVVALIEKLSQAQRKDVLAIPKLALLAIGVVNAITKACISEDTGKQLANFIESRPDRLPMGLMARRIDMLHDKPLRSLWSEIIERWVIAQHVRWSTVRGGDGKQRLRIGFEGRGWIRVGTRAIGPFDPTPDRLATLLSLGSECELFRKGVSVETRFGR